jgi:queuine/archaeosine tRNA-ribosyltransferase
MSDRRFQCYAELSQARDFSSGAVCAVNFLLQLMRMGHMILGITPAKPEHERVFLLGWIVALLLVALIAVGLVLFLVPRIMS